MSSLCTFPHLDHSLGRTVLSLTSSPLEEPGLGRDERPLQSEPRAQTVRTASREVNDSALNCSEISTAWSVYFFLHCCLVSVTSSVSTRVVQKETAKPQVHAFCLTAAVICEDGGPSDSPAPCVFQIICRFEVLAVLTATESKKPPVTSSSQVRSDLEHSRESTQLSNTIHQALHS